MTKTKQSFFRKYKLHIIYAGIILAFGIWQILDWYYGFEDPLWHLLFYLYLIPLVTFIFGITIGDNSKRWLFPFYAALVEFIVFIFLANGGRIQNNLTDLFSVTILFIFGLTFVAGLVGVLIRTKLLVKLRFRRGVFGSETLPRFYGKIFQDVNVGIKIILLL